jgi:dinuclear metal center YbgI/SA1388 family protein
MVYIKDVIKELEILAPLSLQESYDNSGLLVGDGNDNLNGILVCLDCTEAIVQEAINNNLNLIVAHHPIVFTGLKSITGKNYVERVLIKAIKNNISIYAIHTNLDNVFLGVNSKIADKLNLENAKILSPKRDSLLKLSVFVPTKDVEKIKNSLFSNGAGSIGNYSECSFSSNGLGTFKANKLAQPYIGEVEKLHTEEEVKLEVVIPSHLQSKVVSALLSAHPYEEVAYDLFPILNKHKTIGSGMIATLKSEMEEDQFLLYLKDKMNTKCIRHSPLRNKKIKTVAFCGGAGDFLLESAMAQKADVFISGDFKYHRFFDADNKIVIMDIGHFESEQFTIELLGDFLKEKFFTFAVRFTEVNTNPINYF